MFLWLGSKSMQPSLVQPGLTICQTNLSHGAIVGRISLGEICFEISCLVQLCHLYCRGRLWKQSLNHFVLQSFEIILEVLPVWKANCGDASLGLRQQHWQHCGAEGECRKRRRAHRFYRWARMKGIGTLKNYKSHRDSWHSQTVR